MFEFKLSRMVAVAERDLRRFRRNRAFMVPMVLMPIVYLIILGRAMGGDLIAESDGKTGASFTLTLPSAPRAAAKSDEREVAARVG